jgi:hypothetical protein
VPGSDGAEVSVVEGGDFGGFESLGDGDGDGDDR